MNNIEAVNKLMSSVFNDNRKNVLTRREIKKIGNYYKNNYQSHNSIESFCDSSYPIKTLINKLMSGKCEIEKQITQQKALQMGILNECVLIQTLANTLGINNFCDVETTNSIPSEVLQNIPKVQSKNGNTIRYAYYNDNDYDNVIFQCGNPVSIGDATIILEGKKIIIEIKDIAALLQDKDIEYDENGHLLVTEDIENNFSEYVTLIKDFNSRTNIFNEFGHNFPILSMSDTITRQKFISSYIDTSLMDVLMTSHKDKLILIKKNDLIKPLSDGDIILSTKGSEIRTTGKNSKKVFTPNYLRDTLNELGVTINNNVCYVDKSNLNVIGFVKGRGTTNQTRFKLTNCFFVRNNTDTLIDCNDHWEFSLNNILQSKSGISIHISLNRNKAEIKKEFGY